MSLNDELQTIYTQLANANKVKAEPASQLANNGAGTPQATPAPEPAAVAPEVVATVPNVGAGVNNPQGDSAVDGMIDDWDVSQPKPDTNDISELAKEFGFDNVKSKSDFAQAVKQLKESTNQSSLLDNIPSELAQAVKLAAQGNKNYYEYLRATAVDWSKQDPTALFENWVFDKLSEQGKTAEEIEEYINRIDPMDKNLRGRDLQRQFSDQQRQQQEYIRQQAAQEAFVFETKTKSALESLNDVYGFKLNPVHKQALLQDFVNTPVGRALLAQTGGDYTKALQGLFNVKYGEQIDKFRRDRVRNVAKRELLNDLQRPQLNTPTNAAAPSQEKVDPIALYLKELKAKSGL